MALLGGEKLPLPLLEPRKTNGTREVATSGMMTGAAICYSEPPERYAMD